MSATHTPLPWSHGGQLINGAPEQFPNPKAQPMGKTVLTLWWDYAGDCGCNERRIALDEMMANRDFILRAVNAHDDLLAALRQMLDAIYNETHGQPHSPWIESVMNDAQNAIAKATQEPTP